MTPVGFLTHFIPWKLRRKLTFLVVFQLLLLCSCSSDEKPAVVARKRPCVLLIGIDGCRPDALKLAKAPHLRKLIAAGTVTWQAMAGGDERLAHQQQTVSGPGWSSILCGVWRNKHGVADNRFFAHRYARYPHFYKRIREVKPTTVLGSCSSWNGIQVILPSAGKLESRALARGARWRITTMTSPINAWNGSNPPNPIAFSLTTMGSMKPGMLRGFLQRIPNTWKPSKRWMLK